MNKQPTNAKPRRVFAHVNLLGTTQLHHRNPYVVAFWSAMFPGFGHLLLSKYLRAYILFLWEIIINLRAHVNLALLHTILGEFDAAKHVIDIRWSLLYIPTFIFSVWDSYRSAVDLNQQYILAARENAPIEPFSIGPFGISYIDKRSPYVASAWCTLTPGLGHIMLQRIHHGVFVLFWWILVVYFSNILTALHLTFYGAFASARDALNPQWFLNIPSLFFFCVYITYVNSVESNKLFDAEQSQFLQKNYQSAGFPFPGGTEIRGAGMFVVSVFQQSIQVELAVTALEQEGVAKSEILAVPVQKEQPGKGLFDSMHSASGESVLDLPMILGALATLFGCIYGFRLAWGPVLWGIIAAVLGFGVGFVLKLLFLKKKKASSHQSEVVIFVKCDGGKLERIERLLHDNGAQGVSFVAPSPS
ncbi:hypothetical protein SAMN02745823_00965 [Sporobacter termitidis DSM 10068]|uniref:Uncharacterized protein n=1 Tax=Sporobacter termitidis DSM 10068 TaxID=1123282 RepID=A0A1M5VQJ3_9FIRM|nr:hypothetical protein [Sporobacter termitidis]SHH77515.1 hypothetical protein SAMN02745823_00965 [Sporobacter termitidis DSM 10068]